MAQTKSMPPRAASSAGRPESAARKPEQKAGRAVPASQRATARAGGGVLVVAHPRRSSSVWALPHAFSLAKELDREVVILCVFPSLRAASAGPTGEDHAGRAAARVTRWLARQGDVPARVRVLVRFGKETVETRRVAQELNAAFVAVGIKAGVGHEWLGVARETRVPVLLARPPRGSREIVAASDFSAERMPTFSWAVRLAEESEARVTMVHNVDPLGRALSARLGLPLPRAAVSDVRDRRMKKMEALAARAPVSCQALLLEEDDSAEGIAKLVAKKKADVLVVGVHEKERTRMDTARRLVSRVRASVLLVPLETR